MSFEIYVFFEQQEKWLKNYQNMMDYLGKHIYLYKMNLSILTSKIEKKASDYPILRFPIKYKGL